MQNPIQVRRSAALAGAIVLTGLLVAVPGAFSHDSAKGKDPAVKFPQPIRRRKPKPPETVFVGGSSIIRNGGFEKDITDWKLSPEHKLVTNPQTARTGTRCVSGSVRAPSKALRLTRIVPVKKGGLYRYDIWARGTKGTKITVFVTQPKQPANTRESVGVFTNIPGKWKPLNGTFTAEATGDLTIEFITPSSFGAAPGTIWVDDISITEFILSEPFNATSGGGFNDEPAMVRAEDGSFYLAWLSFREGSDTLQVSRLRREGDGFKSLGAWEAVTGPGAYVASPRLVAVDNGVALVYARETNGDWDIASVRCNADGLAKTVRVAPASGVDTDPAVAWDGEKLWIAWESNRHGPRQVLVTSVRDGEAAEPVTVSPAGASCYDPSIAVTEDGAVAVAWHSLVDHNIDIFLSRRSMSGAWTAARRLTQAPAIDRHAVLFTRGAELWVAYENAQMGSYSIGGTRGKSITIARIEADGLKSPKAEGRNTPLLRSGEAAAPLFDSNGKLWLAFVRGNNKDWQLLLTHYAGDRWGRAVPLTTRKGMDRRPSLAIDGNDVIVAFQGDNLPGRFNTLEEASKATSDVYIARHRITAVHTAAPLDLVPLSESDSPFEPATLRRQYGEELATPTIEYKGQTLKLFYGDLHDHTQISICGRIRDESVDESYQDMRDIARHDFACVTDHGYNITPYAWYYTGKMARINTDPGRFVAFLGEEWTSTFEEYSEEHPYGFYGHRNLIFADPYLPRWWNAKNRQTPAEVWADLRKMKADFVQIPHQLADTGNVPVDWNYADEQAQPVAEIFQGRGSYEYLGAPRMAKRSVARKGYFIQDAWEKGVIIGVIASPDHSGGRGKACVYAPELTREALLDAMRRRHCFGSTAAKILLDVRVNGALMGEKIAAPDGRPVDVRITARCPGDIDRIEVCRNNQFVYTATPNGKTADLRFVDEQPLPGRSYYYVRVLQKDEEIAWSSPVWLGY